MARMTFISELAASFEIRNANASCPLRVMEGAFRVGASFLMQTQITLSNTVNLIA